jgi:hypothetical protein
MASTGWPLYGFGGSFLKPGVRCHQIIITFPSKSRAESVHNHNNKFINTF